PSSPVVGQIVTFTATTVDGTAPYTSSWNFGDGTTAAGSAVTHGYAVAGTYTVQVTASDSAAHTATKSKSVVATASAPPPPPGAPTSFGFLGPLEGNPLTIPALGLVFLLFGVAAIRHRLVRTERVRGRHPQAAVEAAGQDDAWDM